MDPPAEVTVDETLVVALLREQHPDLAGLPVSAFANGWDNVSFRLGDELLVRLPRRALGVPLLEHEQRWLATIAARLEVPVPVPVRVGRPGSAYPWPWSVVPLLAGTVAAEAPLATSGARRLGRTLAALHVPATGAPTNPHRGGPLETRRSRFEELRHLVSPAVEEAWAEGLAAPPAQEVVWLHGDLHPHNVLTRDGDLVALIDWGDLCGGDPATDLAGLWLLLEAEDRASALEAYGCLDGALAARARGWAAVFATLFLDSGHRGNASHGRIGADTARRLTGG